LGERVAKSMVGRPKPMQVMASRGEIAKARLGGADGLRLSRAAFAITIKYCDLLDDFQALQDSVALASGEEEGEERDTAIFDAIAQAVNGKDIIRRWESAARMRQWINEKKQTRMEKLEKRVVERYKKEKRAAATKNKEEEEKKKEQEEADAAKKKEEEGAAKTEEAKTLEKDANQIDSSSKPAAVPDKDQDKDQKKDDKDTKDASKDGKDEGKDQEEEAPADALTAEEKQSASDEADVLLAKDLAVAFQKILDKASFLIKLNIPLNFKKKDLTTAKQGGLKMLRAPSTYEGAPKPTLDWEGRLKSWKQMQTSLGAIKSLTERKVEIWNSGITAILALLQTPIEASKIQEQVE